MELISKIISVIVGLSTATAFAAPSFAVETTRAIEASPTPGASDVRAELLPITDSSAAYNWAGYVADAGVYTAVAGTWIVPDVKNPTGNGADATWVGIGGVERHDLIQAGTEALPDGTGGSIYAAWYEMLPDDSHMVPLTVRPGDSVSVSVSEETPNHWLIDFHNNTTGEAYQERVVYESSRSSAEWIEEMPLSPEIPITLNDFGVVHFTSGYAMKDGKRLSIAEAGAEPLHMENGNRETLADVSVLGDNGMSFSVMRTDAVAEPLQYLHHNRMRRFEQGTQVGGESAEHTVTSDDGARVVIIRFFSTE